MPAIMTHHLHGQKVLQRVGRAFEERIDTQDAFIMGCQGPDPFFFATLGLYPMRYMRFGQLLHNTNVTAAMDYMMQFTARSPTKNRDVLSAYLAGYLCHYALDVTAHPYVFAMQYAGCEAMGLSEDKAHLHMRLETAIDTAMTNQFENPDKLMPRNKKVCLIISRMYYQTAKKFYGITLSKRCFLRAIRRVRFLERFLKSKRGMKRKILVRIERGFTQYSMYDAMSHSRDMKGFEDPLNLKKQVWVRPYDKAAQQDSFPELFSEAVSKAARFIELYHQNVSAGQITEGFGFDGIKEIIPSNKPTDKEPSTNE